MASNIFGFIRKAKNIDMFPMLAFNTDESVCKGLFEYIYEFLDKKGLCSIHIIINT